MPSKSSKPSKGALGWLILLTISALAVTETLDTLLDAWQRHPTASESASEGSVKRYSSCPARHSHSTLILPCTSRNHNASHGGQLNDSANSRRHNDNGAMKSNLDYHVAFDQSVGSPLLRYLRLIRLRWRPIFSQVHAIRMIRIEAPTTVQAGQPIRLRCLLEATKGDRLQSLSWYKNGREFYRYQPYDRSRPVLTFNLTGVNLDMTKTRNNTVFLVNTTSETSGRYKCEVTGTSFQEIHMETYISVAAATSHAVSLINSTDPLYVFAMSLVLSYIIPNM